MWDYFANLYKNSNKGIKGRGKDRRISSSAKLAAGFDEGSSNPSASGSDDDPKWRGRSFDRGSYNDISSSDDNDVLMNAAVNGAANRPVK